MKHVLCLFLILVLSSVEGKMIVHGHRGSRAVKPENTLAAMAEALRIGVDVLEMDLVVTRDRIPVLSHEKIVNKDICQYEDGRPVTENIPFISLTLKEVKKFDCGTKPNLKFPKQIPVPGEKIPTLEEVFQLVQKSKETSAKTVEFNIETKIEEDHPELSPPPEEFARLVLDIISKYDMKERVILQSFDFRTLRAARAKMPELRISTLVEGFFSNIVKIARQEKPQFMSPDFGLLSAKKVSELHNMGVKVVPWTLNKESEWRNAISWKVDGIITDDPEALLHYLKSQK
ncbi:MAG: hypothetical protein A4S09_09875 [Proteobacteria bacterium SG_bin7]|nr:MAG: hypothetical protein A4S09_09875 [Proteobacteria bacterium SG_bin7]